MESEKNQSLEKNSQENRERIRRMIRENSDIQFIRMQFTDIFGQLKNIAITISQLERALSNEIMLDGSSIEGFVRVEESDQYLWPDLDTFAILPWRGQYNQVARFICDVHNPDGSPFAGDPRYILKRVLQRAEKQGMICNVGPELEFFLFQTDEDGNPTAKTSDKAGYFDLGPLDHGESTRREICLTLEAMGFEIEASHHEDAPGQHEIDARYSGALKTADRIMTLKLAVKSLAQKNGLHATFMPKPVQHTAGSGMHLNLSLFGQDGRNLFYDENDTRRLSPLAYQFIAGLLAHARGICALTNPLVNSYKRLGSGYEAPRYPVWSTGNRSAMIRIPTPRGQGTRVELRSPDPACNPYLALAACFAAGLDGIAKHLTPPEMIVGNVNCLSSTELAELGIQELPKTLEEAIAALEEDTVITDVLGEHIAGRYIAGKRREWEEYLSQVSQWELDKYLITY